MTGWLRRKRLDERTFLLRHREFLDGLGAAALAQVAADTLAAADATVVA